MIPYIPREDRNLSSFVRHVWVVITWKNDIPRALDACHALADERGPPDGTLSRLDYLDKTLDQERAHGNAEANTGNYSTGNCCK